MVKAFVLDTNEPVSIESLQNIGVLHWRLNPVTYEEDGELSKIRKDRNFSYSDIIITDRAHIPNYDEKMEIFFKEHIHTDDEVRFFIEGSGYFDVRGFDDQWIRIHGNAGDLIILPAGIYHRFRNDESEYAKVMRLFIGDPVWTPFNRSPETDAMEQRKKYIHTFTPRVIPDSPKAFVLDSQRQVSVDYLRNIGILYWKLDPSNYSEKLNQIRTDRNYSYSDVVTISPEHLQDYEVKTKYFFQEHLHRDEEIRFFLEGSGYFDVRSYDNEWIRIHGAPGDLIVLPAGIYHRYSNDEKNYAKVMRLFVGEPVWTPFDRSNETDVFPERLNYLKFLEEHKKIAYGRTNISVENPLDFDRVIFSLSKNITTEKIILYFTAADDPQTNQPWCPDARKAQPLVEQVLSELHGIFFFVKFPIVKEHYRGNSDFFFKVHEKIKLTKIPTMGLWDGKVENRLVEGELHDVENIRKLLLG